MKGNPRKRNSKKLPRGLKRGLFERRGVDAKPEKQRTCVADNTHKKGGGIHGKGGTKVLKKELDGLCGLRFELA